MDTPRPDLRDQASVNAVLLDRSERIEKALFGNGQPGLIANMAAAQADIEELQDRAPLSRTEKWTAWATIGAAFVTGSVALASRFLHA